jgi:hypothetical protein
MSDPHATPASSAKPFKLSVLQSLLAGFLLLCLVAAVVGTVRSFTGPARSETTVTTPTPGATTTASVTGDAKKDQEIADLKKQLSMKRRGQDLDTAEKQVQDDLTGGDAEQEPRSKAPEHVCDIAGSVYVEQIGACVEHVIDRDRVEAVSPTIPNGRRCAHKPIGFKFDVEVVGPDGRKGIAHHHCAAPQRGA